MSRSAPNTPKRGREDELTGIAFPELTFKARAPAAHECPAHDKSAWTQTKYTGPPELTYTTTPATEPHRTVPEGTTARENSSAAPRPRRRPCLGSRLR